MDVLWLEWLAQSSRELSLHYVCIIIANILYMYGVRAFNGDHYAPTTLHPLPPLPYRWPHLSFFFPRFEHSPLSLSLSLSLAISLFSE